MMYRRRRRSRRKRGVSGRTRGPIIENKLDYEGNPVLEEVWILAHSSPLPSNLPDRWVTNKGPAPSPATLAGCNSRNKKNLMTLQRGGELSIVRALSGSSRGDAQPPISHPSLCKENRMQRFLFAMFRIELFFTIENTRLHLFSFFKCGKCGGNFVRFKKYIGGIGEMTYIYIFNCIELVCWTRKRKRLPALPSMAVIKDRQRGNFFQRLIARSRFEAHVFPEKGPRGGHSYRVVRRRFFGETLPSCRDGIIEN